MTTESTVAEINAAYAQKDYKTFIRRLATYYHLEMVTEVVEEAIREHHQALVHAAPELREAMGPEDAMFTDTEKYLAEIKDKVLPFTVGREEKEDLALALINFPNFIEQLEEYAEGNRYCLEFSPLEFKQEEFAVCFFKDEEEAANFLYEQHTTIWPTLHAQNPRPNRTKAPAARENLDEHASTPKI